MEGFMKKLILTLVLFFLMTSTAFSQGFGIGAGFSFWTKNDITLNSIDIIDKNEKPGFNANVRLKFYSGFITYTINAGWNRFVISDISLVEPFGGTDTYNFTLSQNIFPISPGLQLNLIDLKVINIYLGGEVSFNFIKNSIDNSNISGELSLPSMIMFGDETQFRIGAAPSVGVEINLGLITLDVNAKLHFMNVINKKAEEDLTNYLMANVTVFFGGR
jgi:hypothetical protein